MNNMGRIDIVVFPNGGREIFGQISGASMADLLSLINGYISSLEDANKPRKFTGYYDAPDASDIEWMPYDDNNPIVQVPVERNSDETDVEAETPVSPEVLETVSMELAQVPMEMRDKIINPINMSD